MRIFAKKKVNLRREPKGIKDLKKMYSKGINKPFSFFGKGNERKRIVEVVSYVKSLIGESALKNQGEGVQLVFPLTSALGHGEFVKGVLKVIAPKTRVIFLVTPSRFSMTAHPTMHQTEITTRERSFENLVGHIKKSIRPGMRTVVVDDHETGGTFNSINKGLKAAGIIKPTEEVLAKSTWIIGDFVLDYYPNKPTEYRRKLNLGWEKDEEGKYAFDKGNLLRYDPGQIHYGDATLAKQAAKDSNQRRRLIFNLGIAAAKEVLKLEKSKR